MSTVLKFRRGDTTASNAFTGAEGELFVDTTKDTLVVHDGVTAGGKPLATESYVTTQLGSKIALTDLSVIVNPPGSAANFTYNNTTGVFRFTPDGMYNKQDTLVSGTNIKTINGQSILGSGDITISGGGSESDPLYVSSSWYSTTNNSSNWDTAYGWGNHANAGYASESYVGTQLSTKQNTLVSGTNIKTVNGQSILGGGNITVGGGTGGSSLVYGQFADNEIDLTTTTANQVIDSYPASLYRSSKYIIQAVCSGVGIHSTEVMVLHDGTNVYITEYATIFTDTSLFTVDASISGTGDMELTVTPVNANTSFDVVRTSLAARTYEAPSLQGDLMTLSGSEDLQSASGSLDLNV